MEFKYFKDPKNFSYIIKNQSHCSVCSDLTVCFDATLYYGRTEIERICAKCLKNGSLISLDISVNNINEQDLINYFGESLKASEFGNQIVYMTPKLPTWQDIEWPFKNGEFGVFEKIASKLDFKGENPKQIFKNSFSPSEQESSDLDYLWDTLPNQAIKDIDSGSYDISIYLFKFGNEQFCTWDAS